MRQLVRLALLLALLLVGVSSDDTPTTSGPLLVTSPKVEVERESTKKCFHRPAEDCPGSATQRCKAVGNDGVLCCHISSMFHLKEGLAVAARNVTYIKSLHIRNATFQELNMNNLEYRVDNFTISDGYVRRITGRFATSITCLNLSGNALEDIAYNALSSLSHLAILDVSNNNLTQLPRLPQFKTGVDFWLDISGTNKLQCRNIQDLIEIMKDPPLQFLRDNDSFCWANENFDWFNSSMKISLLHVIKSGVELVEKCPTEATYKCKCRVFHSIGSINSQNLPVIVDCSGQGLTELPKELPLNTVALNVSNNKITDIRRLVEDTSYQKIVEFYADNNLISSITILEASSFLKNFDVLSLRDNKIRTIPTYILSNAFEKQFLRTFIVKLGNNKLECNCNTAQVVKVWLVAYKIHIHDLEDIQCEDVGKVQDLDKDKVCVDQRTWTYYIYYIIAAEVALLLLLVVKVSYDYWVFKTAGYLPWPASKMPKLPCDWFFET